MLRKYFAAALTAAALILVSSPAPASAGNPHHEEADGCDHGATGKPCKEDPSENGQDCEVHGNHGGVNEDHCLNPTTTTTVPPTTSTTAPPTTTTTVPPTTTTTTPTPTTTTTTSAPSLTTTTTSPDSPTTTTPSLGCVTDGHPYVTNIEQGGCLQTVAPSTTATAPKDSTETLPRTGWDAGLLFVIGTAVLLAGLSCWFAGKAIG